MSNESSKIDRRLLLQNALAAVEKMQAKLDAAEYARREPIAIIGMGCRFPGGANNPEAYWRLLHDGVDAVGQVPPERWHIGPELERAIETSTSWYGGFLDQVDQFDPQFFGLAPREAMTMDPQQRLVLEVSWEALERAGQAPDKLKGSQTGIFVGITTNDYAQLALQGDPASLDAYTATGGALNVAAGRVAYTLGLQGPSMAVDTACSSSLVAIHLACQSLRSGESKLALAGGVNVLLRPEAFICFSSWGMMAPDGRCKTFDVRADGFVRGEGCGMVVLKRLSDAVAAGDNILALIRGSAINQDGRSSGLTVPNGLAQQSVVRTALANAGLEPVQISYVEAHGTGTALGDPIEVEALAAVLGQGRTDSHPLFLSSVKTNIGHLESAAGIAGLMKVVLCLQNQEIPPHLHLQERSPRIPWPNFPTIIPSEPTLWTSDNGSRLAGVSSFGFSGTNAHVILEEAPVRQPAPMGEDRPVHIFSLSAKNNDALKELAEQYENFLSKHPDMALANITYTANKERAHFEHRLAVIAETTTDLCQKLAAFNANQETTGIFTKQITATGRPKVAFLFTGQGAQYVEMGRQLYETQPGFRQVLDKCDTLLRPYLEDSLLSILYPDMFGDEQPANNPSKIDQTAYTQPALFAVEYALAQLWRTWGIEPDVVIGHSVGEYVAACVAGVFSLEDGLKLIATRGRLMQSLPADGTMAAVFASEQQVAAALAPYARDVSIAAVNGPENVVISGQKSAVQAILDTLNKVGVKSQSLTVSHAFHSPLMDPILEEFEQVAATMIYSAPQIDLISNVTGQLIDAAEIGDAAYWRQHIRQPVQFSAAMQTLVDQGCHLFLEVGPSPTLLGMGKRCLPFNEATVWLASLRSGRSDWQQMLNSLAELYVCGVNVDWAGFDKDYVRCKASLPTYPFQRQRYWLNSIQRSTSPSRQPDKPILHPLLMQRVRSPLLQETIFETQLDISNPGFLDDHRLYGTAIFPGTGYLEMALAAASQTFQADSYRLENVAIQEVMILPETGEQTVQIALSPVENGIASFQIFSRNDETDSDWKLHARGDIRLIRDSAISLDSVALDQIEHHYPEEINTNSYYQRLNGFGIEYGPTFQGLTRSGGEKAKLGAALNFPTKFL